MITFWNPSRRYFITTNYKVLYTSFTDNTQLTRISNRDLFTKKIFSSIFRKNKIKHFYLLRDPRERLVSFYKNKFVQQGSFKAGKIWETCQQLFFADLNITTSSTNEEISYKLLDTSFEQFITFLDKEKMKDLHLIPQCQGLYYRYKKLKLPIKHNIDKFILLDNDEDQLFLKSIITKNIESNVTKNVSVNTTLNEALEQKILKLYERDYKMIQKIKARRYLP